MAGYLTARARNELFNAIKVIGLENLYYTDTDSFVCNEIGYNRLI